jgi:hypothetical protein
MREYCYNCDGYEKVTYKTKEIESQIEGYIFKYVGDVVYCNTCNEEVYVREVSDNNIQTAHKKYRDLVSRKMKMKKQINLKCSCGCKMLSIEKNKYGEMFFEIYSNDFYTKQEGIFSKLKQKLKLMYIVLLGKEHSLLDIYIEKEQSEEVIAELKKFVEECVVEE